jgi:hypothetical protein
MKIIPERDIDRARLKVALEDLHEAVRAVEAVLAREGMAAPAGWPGRRFPPRCAQSARRRRTQTRTSRWS